MEDKVLNWLDYREKLGIGFNDVQKASLFIANILTICRKLRSEYDDIVSDEEYFDFCTTTGAEYNDDYDYFESIIEELSIYENDFMEFLARYIAFINSLDKDFEEEYNRNYFIKIVQTYLDKSNIQFEVFNDENSDYFIFPKGAKEFDDALISEPLEWLSNYPKAHKTYCNALKQYSEGIYIRDVADNLRKALEEFLQEFLGNEKNLESNKDEICRYLGKQGVDSGISGLYQPLINSYKNINDRIAKHNDKIDEKLLEFLLYQTGILIRMTITVKKAEKSDADAK